MATTHIDFRKIDYDQLLDRPITRVASGVNPNTLTTAGVYDRGDGNRFIVDVEGQNISQVIEKKDGYETRSSTDGGTTWSAWDDVQFSKSGDIDAEDVNYDNTTSGLTATDVQAAIDEMNEVVEEIKDIVEVETMPTPSEDIEGTIVQYKGATTSSFTHGYFYECVGDGQNPETFSRVRIDVQPNNAIASSVSYDNTTSGMVATNVQAAIDEVESRVDTVEWDITDIKNIIEVTTMDTPSEDNEGSIVQYKWATNANFTHGYFYECVGDGGNPESFSWERIDVQPAGAWDEHEFITQAAYDLLTPAQKAAKVYMIKEEWVPGSWLTAGAGIDITNDVISADMSTAVYDNTTSGATATNVQDAIDEVFQSVSNGKTLIAAAITDKGVTTAASDSFSTMASNIESLHVWGKYTSNSLWDIVLNYTMPTNSSTQSEFCKINNYEDEWWEQIWYFCLIMCNGLNTTRVFCWRYDQTKGELRTTQVSWWAYEPNGDMSINKVDGKVYFWKSNMSWFCYYDLASWEFVQHSTYVSSWTLQTTVVKTNASSGDYSVWSSPNIWNRSIVYTFLYAWNYNYRAMIMFL